ncbi:MAG: hypothetical protein ACWA5W_11100 [Phycisphaerales bacterium]
MPSPIEWFLVPEINQKCPMFVEQVSIGDTKCFNYSERLFFSQPLLHCEGFEKFFSGPHGLKIICFHQLDDLFQTVEDTDMELGILRAASLSFDPSNFLDHEIVKLWT